MTKFILYVATSIDGYIARSDGSLDWLLPSPEELYKDEDYIKFYNSIDAIVMGSTTYEQILGFGDWAYPGKLSYVLTSRNLSTVRTDIVFMKSVEEIVEDASKRGYQRVWLMGGGKAASPFIQKELVDEYFIFIIPVILGAGISLYQSLPELKLNLVRVREKFSPHGVVELHYKN
ncbi:dihydrofolate reductase [Chroococcidiopsis sp. FACHB-1243]|uniref:dihydrofolate reductase family protein n=1 Tax=Chroococcidiopsis sp. [FACHB-1243] TaxID=2692781 RepID=UPI001786A01D|nr:dihydrofolate reductase family protein [Chroococcidiopsis sp. [FACHB-1243]]MBD2307029.1 dihydrofolate reductase [Chroococcidiopsis sp. [FACHB-1243]]